MDPGSSPETRTTTVVTGSDGSFVLTLPPGPSRTTTARYAGSNQLGRAATELRSTTRSRISFNRSPSRALNGQRVHMYGRVHSEGALIPGGGKLVAIQYLDTRGHDTYRTIALVRTDTAGYYSYYYRFKSITRPTRIRFRSVAESEATWPFTRRGSVKSRTVTVYP